MASVSEEPYGSEGKDSVKLGISGSDKLVGAGLRIKRACRLVEAVNKEVCRPLLVTEHDDAAGIITADLCFTVAPLKVRIPVIPQAEAFGSGFLERGNKRTVKICRSQELEVNGHRE